MIEKIVSELKEGNVVILPTDTVYGLHADALNVKSIKKVDTIKNSNKPHLILISNFEMLNKYVKNITDLHYKIIDKYWPGELTILFEKNKNIPNALTKDSNYIGIRMPNNKLLLDIINKLNSPILSTSANISGNDVITNISKLDKSIKNSVSFIYDGGNIISNPSTLIKIENNKIIILREGKLANKIKSDFKEYL